MSKPLTLKIKISYCNNKFKVRLIFIGNLFKRSNSKLIRVTKKKKKINLARVRERLEKTHSN